jgi:hypothetical protein
VNFDAPLAMPEESVRDCAVDTFRQLLTILAPNICGFEMRALPDLVVEGARRTAANRDQYKRLYEQRGKDAAEAEDQAAAMRSALWTLHDELLNFAHYSRAVSSECEGQRRLTWYERAEWADRLAALAKGAS